MELKQEVYAFIKKVEKLYYEQRDSNALLLLMDKKTSWIGTEFLEKQEFNESFTVIKADYQVNCISETTAVVLGEICAKPNHPDRADLYHRLTIVCVRKPEGMRLALFHVSYPDTNKEEENNWFEGLTENIPGGVYQCECDEELTFIRISHSFLSFTGYSYEEIQERFHNHYAEMIYPEDRMRIRKEAEEELTKGDFLEVEYRLWHKDGRLLWILDQKKRAVLSNGKECFYCMLVDITRRKEQKEELRLSLECHRIIMNQTTDIIFEWDIRKDMLTVSANWCKKFGYDPIREHISQRLPLSPNIYAEDIPEFTKIMDNIAAGTPYCESEFRIRDILGNFTWNRIRITTQYDMHSSPIKAVGVIIDIDADKKQRERLIEQAQHDALTGLYNKTATRELVERKMMEGIAGREQALFILDVDDFKLVNDSYGHLCGDSLLSDIALILRSHFRSSDIIGRIGGDEFLIYLPEIIGQKEAAAKAKEVLEALQKLKPSKAAAPITCSMGIALFAQKSIDYYALYKCADMALYQIKALGKNNFAFYDPENFDSHLSYGLAKSAVGAMDSEKEGKMDIVGEQLAQYTFRMLYSSIDINTAVNQLLEILGKAYGVSRVYIFESSQDGERCSNTFEWCNTGVESEIDQLKNLSYKEDLGDYLRNFDENNIFYCQDIHKLHPDLYGILAPQGICSLLQCAIMDDAVFKGYVGFDECRENRSWTKEQISSLTLIANILSTFLLKYRLKERIINLKLPQSML